MTISKEVLYELIDSVYGAYGIEGENIQKTGFLIFKERQARANIYREIFVNLIDPDLFGFFAYLSLADGALFYDYFDDDLQQKVECTAPICSSEDHVAWKSHNTFSWMHEAYLTQEFSREQVKTPEFWMRFIPEVYRKMIATYEWFDFDANVANATTEALRALRRCIMEEPN